MEVRCLLGQGGAYSDLTVNCVALIRGQRLLEELRFIV